MRSVGDRRVDLVGALGRCCEADEICLNESACGVADASVGQLALDGIGKFGIADRVGCIGDRSCHSIIARCSFADGPVDGGAGANGVLPVDVGLRKEIGPYEGAAAAIGAVYDNDLAIGQGDVAIDGGDPGVVPAADFAQVDVGENIGGKVKIGASVGQIVDWHYRPKDGGELEHGSGHRSHLHGGQGNVRCCKGKFPLAELLDTCVRANRVVRDEGAGVMLSKGTEPGKVERSGEGGAAGSEGECGVRCLPRGYGLGSGVMKRSKDLLDELGDQVLLDTRGGGSSGSYEI